jgi:hypothetical protein
VITDAELLAACRAAGPPGTESHRLACRLYRRSVIEWQAQSPVWQAERDRLDALRRLVILVARRVEAQALRDAARCGSRGGYHRHLREETAVCRRCRTANRDYDRPRKRAQRLVAAIVREGLAEAA